MWGGGWDTGMEAKGEGSTESRPVEKIADPGKPSDAEVRQHEVAHLPYRNWCWACFQGRGRHRPHRARQNEGGLQEIHFNFMFLGDRDDPGGTRTCIVARDVGTRMVLATILWSKSGDRFVIDRVIAFLSETGCLHAGMVVRADQEDAAIKFVVEEVGKRRAPEGGGKRIIEHSLVGSSAPDGVVERDPVGPGAAPSDAPRSEEREREALGRSAVGE